MSRFSTEEDLRKALLIWLEAKGHQPEIEVPFLGRSIDVAYSCADGSITVIELKLLPKDIRRAYDQAKICLLGANRVYVCVPEYKVSNRIESMFENLGIGLMFSINQNCGSPTFKYRMPAARPNHLKRDEYSSILRRAITNRRGSV